MGLEDYGFHCYLADEYGVCESFVVADCVESGVDDFYFLVQGLGCFGDARAKVAVILGRSYIQFIGWDTQNLGYLMIAIGCEVLTLKSDRLVPGGHC